MIPKFLLIRQCRYNTDIVYTPMILADVFKCSEFARHSDYSTNDNDDPVVVQFAANKAADLADAAELVAPFAGGIGKEEEEEIEKCFNN